ncbi:MAG: DUF3822 family protein [Muribaculaceae bacterium]
MSSTLSGSTQDVELQHPELWTLHLALGADSLQYVIFTTAQADSLISGEIALDDSFGSYLKSLENCIYDNPVLLKPYGKVRITAQSQRFMLLPAELASDQLLSLDAMEAAFPDAEGEFAFCSLPHCQVSIGFELPKGVEAFLARTFFNPPIYHILAPLCEYHCIKQQDSTLSRMYLHLSQGNMQLCIFKAGQLLMANSYPFSDVNNAAYYALNAWQTFELDAISHEVQISGDKELRALITPMLRKYIQYVMPTIFPAAALRIGHDAMKAPYHLILLALCEL